MMMLLYIKQHLSNILSPIHEKLSNTEAELKNTVAYEKIACTQSIKPCFHYIG